MKHQIYLLLLLFTFVTSLSAETSRYYAIEFVDKEHNRLSIEKPSDFLSKKAILRRKNQNIAITSADLPITAGYLYQIKKRGAKVIYTSKWLNTAVVICDESVLPELEKLFFVKEISFVGTVSEYDLVITDKKKKRRMPNTNTRAYYGESRTQIEMLNGIFLHSRNKRGQGISVAVLDGGFWRADDLRVLRKMRKSRMQSKNYDIINQNRNVFESSAHGTEVLSIMAADLPGVMVGTAPDADYVCLKTEDITGEFWLDEYTWVAGLEYADSIGIDLVVSSLGYTIFNDSTMNYTYEDLQSNNAISTRAANIAYEKGMIIVCSAGNEGENDWKYVSCPADGKGVLAVGSTNKLGVKASFTSLSYEINGVMKPDVNALGMNVTVASVTGKELTKESNGTSYSAPIIGGLTASLWSAFPECSNKAILDAVKRSAEENNAFGLPDFMYAYMILSKSTTQYVNSEHFVQP